MAAPEAEREAPLGEQPQGDGVAPSVRARVKRMVQLSSRAWTHDRDLDGAVESFKEQKRTWPMFWGLAYRAIGVVYGDLGTSPLYTYPTVFASRPSRLAVYGSCSLILWILLLQLVVKYLLLTLYADDGGEGGTFALYSLLCRHLGITPFGKAEESDAHLSRYSTGAKGRPRRRLNAALARWVRGSARAQLCLLLLVLFGTAMLLGDGVLTCAIEVLSAVSGLELRTSISQGAVVGISIAVLLLLFSAQRLGTSRIGALFSPVLLLWFAMNAALGCYCIARHEPGILRAFNPAYGFRYLVSEGRPAWASLGGIILCVTGAEAMFNDLGHFSRPAIQLVTAAVLLPPCLLTYLGNAAFLVKHPDQYANAYFAAVPPPVFWPVFVVATLASIVAAQSLISAVFSLVRQAAALHCFPPVAVVQTSGKVAGQVYLPSVNALLCGGSIAAVAGFRSTVSMGHAFGVAFISVMMTTTVLVTLVMLLVWQTHPALALSFGAFFLLLEGFPATALLAKVPHGAWFPLALGLLLVAISFLWHYGCSQRLAHSQATAASLTQLLRPLSPGPTADLALLDGERRVARVPGLAIYHTETLRGLPASFCHLVAKLPAVHQTVVFLTVRQVPLPSTGQQERFLIRALPVPGFFRAVVRYGYQDTVDHGPAFVADLTTRIAVVVRFAALTGAAPVDSALELPRGDAAAAPVPPPPAEGAVFTGVEDADEAAGLGAAAEPAALVLRAPDAGVLYVHSKTTLLAKPGSGLVRRVALESLFPVLARNSRQPTASWKQPLADVVEVGVLREI